MGEEKSELRVIDFEEFVLQVVRSREIGKPPHCCRCVELTE
jgi:hypothetical protein